MQMFIDYFKEYWVLFVILFVALVVLVVVYAKMGKSMAKRKAEKEAFIKKLDHMKAIREAYSELTEEKILSDSGENLLEGVADNIQVRLEKEDDMNSAFEKLTEEEKTVYAFHYFLEESKTKPSEFFRQFTKPLTPYAISACEKFLEKEAFAAVKNLYDSYDEDNETESVIPEKTASLDERIIELDIVASAKEKAAEYIKANVSQFV